MKKVRLLAASLIVATTLAGAGYAAWTDKLTISNTVSTGEMKVEFVKQNDPQFPRGGSYYYMYNTTAKQWQCQSDKTTYITCTPNQATDNKSLTVNVANMYPGSLASYEAKIENKGTIPAVIDNVELKLNKQPKESKIDAVKWNSDAFQKNLQVYGGITYYHKVAEGKYEIDKSKNRWIYSYVNTFAENFTKELHGIRIEPSDYITFDLPEEYKEAAANAMGVASVPTDNCINFWLAPEAGNEFQNQGASFDITVNFGQHNVVNTIK